MSEIEKTKEQFNESLANFLSRIQKTARTQFAYDLETNVPNKTVKLADCPDHAIEIAFISAINQKYSWSTSDSIRLAADLCEDSNAHGEAAAIRKMLEN